MHDAQYSLLILLNDRKTEVENCEVTQGCVLIKSAICIVELLWWFIWHRLKLSDKSLSIRVIFLILSPLALQKEPDRKYVVHVPSAHCDFCPCGLYALQIHFSSTVEEKASP